MLMVLLDLSDTFESLEHTKLHSLELCRSSLVWFPSYLSERSQYARIGSLFSELGS